MKKVILSMVMVGLMAGSVMAEAKKAEAPAAPVAAPAAPAAAAEKATVLTVEGLADDAAAKLVVDAAKAVKGVSKAEANVAAKEITVTAGADVKIDDVIAAIGKAGAFKAAVKAAAPAAK